MKKILFMLLAVSLILSIFATGCGLPWISYPAPIENVAIWADNSSPPQYFVDAVSWEPTVCDHFDSYNVTRADSTTIIIEIINLRIGTVCPDESSYIEHTIPLGSDFVLGVNYTVEVNGVVETFVA
jgi:hypothetical protein